MFYVDIVITMDLLLVCIQINNTVTFVIKNYEEKVNQKNISIVNRVHFKFME